MYLDNLCSTSSTDQVLFSKERSQSSKYKEISEHFFLKPKQKCLHSILFLIPGEGSNCFSPCIRQSSCTGL